MDANNCTKSACELHTVARGLLAGTLAGNLVIPLFYCLFHYFCLRARSGLNTLSGLYVVTNGILASSAATMIWAVEHHLCPKDSAIEIVAALFLFCTITVSGMGARSVFTRGYRFVPPPMEARRSKKTYRNMDNDRETYVAQDSTLRHRIHSASDEEIV